MKRPVLTQLHALLTKDQLSIRGQVHLQSISVQSKRPISHWRKLRGRPFEIKMLYPNKTFALFETDVYGNLWQLIPRKQLPPNLTPLSFFELSYASGFELNLGDKIPLKLSHPLKVVISDLDKTLVETHFKTPKEIYHTVTKPFNEHHPVEAGVSLLKTFISQQFHPFIVSSSPHFFSHSIEEWLHHQGIHNAELFLKDYRHIIGLNATFLSPKDIAYHGFYKISQIVNIILCTGSSLRELILMGDSMEADLNLYTLIYQLFHRDFSPWAWMDRLQGVAPFNLTVKQRAVLLDQLYQFKEKWNDCDPPQMTIYIRKIGSVDMARKKLLPFLSKEVDSMLAQDIIRWF